MILKTFIERPVLSTVISVVIALLGVIGLKVLPIEQYPDIAPPTVMVMTQYFGASAETVQKSVIAPLEEAINGVENMTYMTSTASNTGTAEIFVYFKQGTDPDMAAVNVQNKISAAMAQLPAEVKLIGVQAFKRQTSMLQIFTVSSPDDSYDEEFLSNYILINIKPEMLRIQGVGQLVVLGGTYSMRVWMKPDVMAQHGLVPGDVISALAQQNIESATGSIGENANEAFQYTMKYKGRLQTPEEFGEIVIRATPNGEVLKLKDIADIKLGIESYGYQGMQNGHPGVQCMVFQTAGSNATEVNQQIDALLADVQANAPKGVKITQMMSTNDFLFASIKNVIITLLEAILLVILVILLFLQDWRSTMIPFVSIIVSLVGTFAFMIVAGFSINLITLFALVLVIGTVVDNSIVIVEAVHSRFEQGYKSPFQAAAYGTKDVAIAIITSSLVFMAVFIPVSFMGGTSGVFYRQFGLTMAVAVGISTVNALTLCPAMCALMLRPKSTTGKSLTRYEHWKYLFSEKWNNGFERMTTWYQGIAKWFIKRPVFCFLIAIMGVGLMVVLMRVTKTSLVPEEDLGTVMINIDTPPGSSLATTNEIVAEIEQRLMTIPEVAELNRTSGYGLISGESAAAANIILKLRPWDERTKKEESVNAVIGKVYAMTADIKDAKVFAMAPAQITGYGTGNALDINLQDKMGGDLHQFYGYAQQFIGALNQREEIGMAFTSFNLNFPQWEVSVDAVKCQRSGITTNEVLGCLSGYYGGQYVSDFNRFGKVYKVQIMGDPQQRLDERSLDNTYVRLHNGQMAPLSQFVTLRRIYGADKLTRFNMYNSIAVSAMPAEGYSSGDAIRAVQEVAKQTLPQQYAVDFGGITREESQQTSGGTAMIFLISILLIYLILAALYESFWLPLAIIIAVPVGLMGSFLLTKIAGLENNIYLQTGVIMLIGLLSKTAILITEYAVERRKQGMPIAEAATEAAGARLRAILMTVLTMIFGMLPLVVATGVGANGNRSLGTGVVGGSVIGTLALLLLVPAFFVVFQKLQEKFQKDKK
ncbi:MAG: efflux RND transporter permease subunit [Paludibacteraceae bacterium]|nr:efflux RND transporter permease subunit [Paludibacteraceae bacterium]